MMVEHAFHDCKKGKWQRQGFTVCKVCPLQSTLHFNCNEVNSANTSNLCSKDNKRSIDNCTVLQLAVQGIGSLCLVSKQGWISPRGYLVFCMSNIIIKYEFHRWTKFHLESSPRKKTNKQTSTAVPCLEFFFFRDDIQVHPWKASSILQLQ